MADRPAPRPAADLPLTGSGAADLLQAARPPVPHTIKARHEYRGMRTAEHYFEVPLDHFGGDAAAGETITVFAREYVSTDHTEEEAARLPWLLYLQGGPGGRGNRLASLGGWSKAAAKDFRILMLDQRGTGLSSAIDRNTLPLRGNDADQADYLAHFRADSIVADAEAIRLALGSAPWTIYGQSYGGFCALSYLSFAPEGLREALITGGLGPLAGPADRVYRATFRRVAARNAEYFGRYPEDRAAVTRIARHLRDTEEFLPDGGRLTVERFQMVGSFLGGNTRVDALHHLLEDAFAGTPGGDRLSDAFLDQLRATRDGSSRQFAGSYVRAKLMMCAGASRRRGEKRNPGQSAYRSTTPSSSTNMASNEGRRPSRGSMRGSAFVTAAIQVVTSRG